MGKIGYISGVYDLFHVGHLIQLERCKEFCDTLVVGVCNDDYVKNVKHKKPVIPEDERVRIISALKCVDSAFLVSPEETDDKKLILNNKCHFDVLFAGEDWRGTKRYQKAEEEFGKLGVSIEYLPYTKGISTTEIKQRILELY